MNNVLQPRALLNEAFHSDLYPGLTAIVSCNVYVYLMGRVIFLSFKVWRSPD